MRISTVTKNLRPSKNCCGTASLTCRRPVSLGEMVLNIGKAVYLHKKGAHGVIDISPFTCMNGIICEAVYPRVSRDLGGFPMRNFYFDGAAIDLDRDLGIFVELARNFQRRQAGAKPEHQPRSKAARANA